jgi:hypothetical protein
MSTYHHRSESRVRFLLGIAALWLVFGGCAVFEYWPVTRYTGLARGSVHHWVAFGALCVALASAAWYSRPSAALSRWLTIFNVGFVFAASEVFIESALSPATSGKGAGAVVFIICLAVAFCAALAQSVFLTFSRHA